MAASDDMEANARRAVSGEWMHDFGALRQRLFSIAWPSSTSVVGRLDAGLSELGMVQDLEFEKIILLILVVYVGEKSG